MAAQLLESNITFSIDFDLTAETKDLEFTDLLSADYDPTYGKTLSNVLGILQISGPNGVLYTNVGWETDSFASPDIDGGTPLWSKSVNLPLDSEDEVQLGTYTIVYKLSVTAIAAVFATVTKTYDYQFETPTAVIGVTSSCKVSTMTIVDNTDYTVNIDGTDYDPVNILIDAIGRDFTIRWPLSSGQSNDTSTAQSVTIGPNIWTGQYDILLDTEAIYNLEEWNSQTWVIVHAQIYGEYTDVSGRSGYIVENEDYSEQLYQAFKNIDDSFLTASKTNTKEAQRFEDVRNSLSYYMSMYEIAREHGYDTTFSVTKMRELVGEEGWTLGSDTSSKEVIAWASIVAGSTTVGSTILNGTAVPATGLGSVGDYYIRTGNGHFYEKTGVAMWTYIMTIEGAAGAAGSQVSILWNDISDDGTTATIIEKTLKNYTLTADTIVEGDVIYVESLIQFGQNDNGKTVKFYFGVSGATFDYYTETLCNAQNDRLTLKVWITCTGAATQFINYEKYRKGSPGKVYIADTTDTETISGDIIIKITGQNKVATINDIVCKQLKIEHHKI